jgi:hypothetical protein
MSLPVCARSSSRCKEHKVVLDQILGLSMMVIALLYGTERQLRAIRSWSSLTFRLSFVSTTSASHLHSYPLPSISSISTLPGTFSVIQTEKADHSALLSLPGILVISRRLPLIPYGFSKPGPRRLIPRLLRLVFNFNPGVIGSHCRDFAALKSTIILVTFFISAKYSAEHKCQNRDAAVSFSRAEKARGVCNPAIAQTFAHFGASTRLLLNMHPASYDWPIALRWWC